MNLARRINTVIVAFALFGGLAPITQMSGQATSVFTGVKGGYGTSLGRHLANYRDHLLRSS
jgi:hypothetical protein